MSCFNIYIYIIYIYIYVIYIYVCYIYVYKCCIYIYICIIYIQYMLYMLNIIIFIYICFIYRETDPVGVDCIQRTTLKAPGRLAPEQGKNSPPPSHRFPPNQENHGMNKTLWKMGGYHWIPKDSPFWMRNCRGNDDWPSNFWDILFSVEAFYVSSTSGESYGGGATHHMGFIWNQ